VAYTREEHVVHVVVVPGGPPARSVRSPSVRSVDGKPDGGPGGRFVLLGKNAPDENPRQT